MARRSSCLSLAVLVVAWYGGLGPGYLLARPFLYLTWPGELTHPEPAAHVCFYASVPLVQRAHGIASSIAQAGRARSERPAEQRACAAREKGDAMLREQAERLARLRDGSTSFLAMLAHELRNPLAACERRGGDHRALARPRDDLEWSRNSIQRNIKQLARLIDDLLDVSRVTRGKIELRKNGSRRLRWSIKPSIHSIPACDQRTPDCRVPSSWFALVDADPARLQQIVSNLLTNAIQYSEDRKLHPAAADAASDGEVFISVRDKGQGIPSDLLASRLRAVHPGRPVARPNRGGLGIGANAWSKPSPSCTAETSPPRVTGRAGKRIRVRLPCGQRDEDGSPATRPRCRAAERSGNRILVVDDNVDLSRPP